MICDHIDNFKLTDEVLRQHGNEAGALAYLYGGLEYLHHQVEEIELRIDPNVQVFSLGNDPRMTGIPRGFVTCCFHWYATSACNFVKLVGWLRKQHDAGAQEAEKYVKSVLPEVHPWRNKIGAHFALHTPRRDTPAELQASVLAPIAFSDDAFYASPMEVITTRAGQTSTSAKLRPWSLTKVHQQLRVRYGTETVSGTVFGADDVFR